jgi:chromosome segregation protein
MTAADSDLLRVTMEQKRVGEVLSQLDGNGEKLEETKRKLNAQIEQSERQSAESASELKQLDDEIRTREAELSESRDKNSAAAEERARLSERLSELKITDTEQAKDAQALKMSLEQINASIDAGKGDEGRLLEQIVGCERAIEEKRAEIEKISEKVGGSGELVAELEEKIKLAQAAQFNLNAAAEKLRAETKNKTNERETLSGDITRYGERSKTVQSEFDKLAGQLWDDYGLTRSEAEEKYDPPEDIRAAQIRLKELQGQIKALGNVNLGAIEEYAEVSQRHEFMTSQLEDVNKSKLELEELIDSLTESMKSIFTESFDRINKRFSEIFVELFGGGKASLSLTDPENVLECGIDINVAPPGKVIKNLMALSGGEKAFIAVCIYFAILTVRPSPFCLLDEIEAALDDVNVAKYAAYLHKFTDKTQFITITHRRGTMEEADVLYGVTMQEDGISKLLRMDMEDTKQMKLE